MKNIFLIFGYGVPKNILKDEKYNFYLKMVFNGIYELTTKNNIKDPMIIACGGPTDMIKPYKRTEADEMIRFLKNFIKDNNFLKPITKGWEFIPENTSLSTLENILHSQKIIKKRKIGKSNIYIFCEETRKKRVNHIAKKIFDKNYHIEVKTIDFDTSENRYLPQEFIDKKERSEIKHSLWALKSPENLKKHHKTFKEKFVYFRKMYGKKDVNAVKNWWEKKLKELEG